MARTKGRDAAATREQILLAAQDVVLTDGVAHLTIDKTAERAGLSKGGVLYHYGTRRELITAMVARLTDHIDNELERIRDQEPEMSYGRAYIEECLATSDDEEVQREDRVGAALIAAIAGEAELLQPLQQGYRTWQRRIEAEASNATDATVARLAADGLWLCELFGIDSLTPQMRQDVAARLRELSS